MADATAGGDIAGRAGAYGVPSAVVDGNDLWAVRDAAAEAVARARDGDGPDAARVPDLPPLRALQERSGALPDQGGGGAVDRARSTQDRPRPAARGRPVRGAGRRGGGGDRARRSSRRSPDALAAPYPDPAQDAATEFAQMSTLEFRTAIRDALAEELERDPVGRLLRRGRRRRRRGVQGDPGPVQALRPRPGVRHADLRAGARRSRLRRRGDRAAARSSRSCSATSWRCRWTASSTRRRSSGTSATSRERSRSSCARPSAPAVASARFTPRPMAPGFRGCPGLKIAFPSSPAEAKGLLKGAIRDDNPVAVPRAQAPVLGQGPGPRAEQEVIPLGQAPDRPRRERPDDRLGRQGRARRAGGGRAPGAGRHLGRGRRPADAAPARRWRRCSSRWRAPTASWPWRRARAPAAGRRGLLGAVAEEGLHDLDDAWILATAETPIPYSPTLEDAFLPQADAIADSVAARLGVAAPAR